MCRPPRRDQRVSQVTYKLSSNGQSGVNSTEERRMGLRRGEGAAPRLGSGWMDPSSPRRLPGMRSSPPPFLPASLSLPSHTRSDPFTRGAVRREEWAWKNWTSGRDHLWQQSIPSPDHVMTQNSHLELSFQQCVLRSGKGKEEVLRGDPPRGGNSAFTSCSAAPPPRPLLRF